MLRRFIHPSRLARIATIGSLALFASCGVAEAAQISQDQGVQATVQNQISWGSQGGCQQNVSTNDFGALVPGSGSSTFEGFDALPHASASTDTFGHHVWVGCVTANSPSATLVASGLHNMTAGADTLPLSDVSIGVTNDTGSAWAGSCDVGANYWADNGCRLPVDGTTSQVLAASLPFGTSDVEWQYALTLPANQPEGSYTGGS